MEKVSVFLNKDAFWPEISAFGVFLNDDSERMYPLNTKVPPPPPGVRTCVREIRSNQLACIQGGMRTNTREGGGGHENGKAKKNIKCNLFRSIGNLPCA